MNFGSEIVLNLDDLTDFIYRSKKECFAKSDLKVSQSDGSSIYSNRELPWLYVDHYCGNTIERGTEDVYYDMVLIWSMQYRGGILETHWPISEAISRFLKYALIELPKEFPVRGPREFRLKEFESEGEIFRGSFIYTNNPKGDIKRFIGYEEILWNGDIAFYHDYIGGLIRNKYFKTKVI